jgi:uncharacterized protein YrrD
MQFKEGAKVFTSDGEKVGSVDRVVLDPRTKEVTHAVVRKGFLFAEDKVVPVSLIGAATEERVVLREDAGDLEALPDFEETFYVPIGDAETHTPLPPDYARPLYWYPPVSTIGWGGPIYPPLPPYVVETERHIPEGTVALKEGARVISSEGEHVGNVEAVLTGPQADRATHLLVSRGLILTENKLVPTTWVSRVGEDEVHLLVGSRLLEQLPEYQPQV